MNYQEFITIVNDKTNQLLFPNTSAQVHTTLKNNGTERIGLTICQEGTNISPTIYLEEYYQHFQNGRDIDEICEHIVTLYHEVKFEHDWDVNQIKDFSSIKSKIAFKLIHFEKNSHMLNTTPHIPYLDLAIVFFLLLETNEHGAATILINYDLLSCWDISLEELHKYALENTPTLLQADFKPMLSVIQELMEKENLSEEVQTDNCMYVLSNQYRHFGAACMLYDRVLEDIGNLINEDFYILPSSIHEVIILPASTTITLEDLNEMVAEVNETQVSEEEILSDHAYFFRRQDNLISDEIS